MERPENPKKSKEQMPKSLRVGKIKRLCNMKRFILIVGIALSIPLFFSCATLFGPRTHALALSSEPHGADVFVNGYKMGTTPVELKLKADKSYTIEFRKEGYESVTRIVNTKIGAGWVILDVLGGLIPVVIDAVTGSWSSLDQKSVNAALVQQKVASNN